MTVSTGSDVFVAAPDEGIAVGIDSGSSTERTIHFSEESVLEMTSDTKPESDFSWGVARSSGIGALFTSEGVSVLVGMDEASVSVSVVISRLNPRSAKATASIITIASTSRDQKSNVLLPEEGVDQGIAFVLCVLAVRKSIRNRIGAVYHTEKKSDGGELSRLPSRAALG